MHYTVHSLHDGTVLAGYPVRKPIPKMIKNNRLTIDQDGVCREWADSGNELFDKCNENRMRFQGIVATRLNTRRAIRELVFPKVQELQNQMNVLHEKIDQLKEMLASK